MSVLSFPPADQLLRSWSAHLAVSGGLAGFAISCLRFGPSQAALGGLFGVGASLIIGACFAAAIEAYIARSHWIQLILRSRGCTLGFVSCALPELICSLQSAEPIVLTTWTYAIWIGCYGAAVGGIIGQAVQRRLYAGPLLAAAVAQVFVYQTSGWLAPPRMISAAIAAATAGALLHRLIYELSQLAAQRR